MTSKTRAALSTEQATNFADNTTGAITPAVLRSTVQDMIDSTGTLLDSNAWTGSAMSFSGSVAFTGNVAISGSSLSVSAISNFTASVTFSAPILVDNSITSGVSGSTAGQILVAGSTSGNTTIVAAAAASGTNTLQATTDTFVYLATSDTLTNKTINVGSVGSAGSNVLQLSGQSLTRGQFPGTNTNDSGTAGNIGELISSNIAVGSAVNLGSGTPANMTSISLTAGDWDVSANFYFNPNTNTSVTLIGGSISQTSATLDSTTLGALNEIRNAAFVPGASNIMNSLVGPLRVSLSGTTTVYGVAVSAFTVSTMSVYGSLRGRRAR